MLLPVLLVLISLVLTASAVSNPQRTVSNSLTDACPDTDPLACYLYSKSITIPEIDLDLDGGTLVITNFVCTKFLIKDILSKYLYATNFFAGADGVGTTCSGHYTYGRMKGDMTAVISKTNVNVTLDVTKNKEYPTGIQLTECAIPSMAISLTFSSSGLDTLAPMIAKLLQSFFETIVCTGLKTLLEGTVTDAINQKIDPMLAYIVASQPSPLPTQYGPHFLNWNSSIISTIHNIFSIQHLPNLENLFQFLQCASSPLPTPSFDALQTKTERSPLEDPVSVSAGKNVPDSFVVIQEDPTFFDNQGTMTYEDIAKPPIASTKQWEDLIDQIQYFLSHPHLIDFTTWLKPSERTMYSSPEMNIVFSYLKIVKIREPHGIKLLQPMTTSKVSLQTAFQCKELHIQVGLDVLTNNATTVTSYYVDLQMDKVNFELDLSLAIDKHLLSSYFFDQLLLQDQFACFWSSVHELSIPNFALSNRLTNLQLVLTDATNPNRRLEADIVQFVDELSRLLVSPSGFQTLTDEVITGVLQGPLRHTLNSFFAAFLSKKHKRSPCLSHYPYDDATDYIAWSSNSVYMKLITLINDYWGVNKVNQVMNCATNATGTLTLDISTLLSVLEASNVFLDGGGKTVKSTALSSSSSAAVTAASSRSFDMSKVTIRHQSDSPDQAVPLFSTSSSASPATSTATAASSSKDYELVISGLNSFYAFELLLPVLDPSDPDTLYQLTNSFGLGACGNSSCHPLTVTLQPKSAPTTTTTTNTNAIPTIDLHPKQGLFRTLRSLAQAAATITTSAATSTSVTPAVSLSLAFQNLQYFTNFLMKLNMASVYDLQGKDVYASSQCGMATVDQLTYLSRLVNITDTMLTITTPNLGTHTTTNVDISTVMNTVLSHLMATEKVLAVENSHWEERLDNATATCPATMSLVVPTPSPTPTPDPSNTNNNDSKDETAYYWAWAAAGGGIGAIIMSGIYYLLYRYYNTGDNNSKKDPSSGGDEENADNQLWYTSSVFGPVPNPFAATSATAWSTSTHGHPTDYALLYHPRLSLAFRLLIPIAILGNIALFIDSNMLPDAVSVMVDVTVGQHVISLGSIFDFGLGNTVQDMWDAQVYALAVLIIFFSGLWPYIKLVAMLACWCVPIQWLSLPTRETLLVFVDAAGKWSLLDFFVMVLMLCSFYCELTITPELIVTVTVHPKFGFYSFVLATIISLALGHILVACHRYVTEPPASSLLRSIIHAEEQDDNAITTRATTTEVGKTIYHSLATTTYIFYWDESLFAPLTPSAPSDNATGTIAAPATTNGNNHGKRRMFVKFTWLGCLLIMLIFAVTMGTFVLAMYQNTIGFEFKGLMGLLLRDAAEVEYSLYSVGQAIPPNSGMPHDFAILWTQAMYYLFTLAMPAALLGCLLILWVVPLSFATQRHLLVLTEILNAWAALDVFCVATAASLLEIEQFAQFIVGDSCDGINNYLTKPILDMLLEGDDVCFDVVAYLTSSCWMLFVPAAGIFLLSTISLITAEYMVMQRVHPDYLLSDLHATSFSSPAYPYQTGSGGHEGAGAGIVSEEMVRPLLSPIGEEADLLLPPPTMLLPEEHHLHHSSSGHHSRDHVTGDAIAALQAVSSANTSPLLPFRRTLHPTTTTNTTTQNTSSTSTSSLVLSPPGTTAATSAGTSPSLISHTLQPTSTWSAWYRAQTWQKTRYQMIAALLHVRIFQLVKEEPFLTTLSGVGGASLAASYSSSWKVRSPSISYRASGTSTGGAAAAAAGVGVNELVAGSPQAFFTNPMKSPLPPASHHTPSYTPSSTTPYTPYRSSQYLHPDPVASATGEAVVDIDVTLLKSSFSD